MKNRGKELFNKLYQDTQLTETEYKELLELHTDKEIAEYGFELARKRQKETFLPDGASHNGLHSQSHDVINSGLLLPHKVFHSSPGSALLRTV